MMPLLVLAGLFTIGVCLGALGVRAFRDWRDSLRYALAAMFLLTASAHFGSLRPDLVRMVPPFFPEAELLVTLTGLAEIAGAVGLLVPRLTRLSAAALSLLLISIFPANVYAALNGLSLAGEPLPALLPRTAIQLVFIAATLAVAVRPGQLHFHGQKITS